MFVLALIGNLAAAVLILLFGFSVLVYGRELIEYLAERKQQRDFRILKTLSLALTMTLKLHGSIFSGESKLSGEVAVIIPILLESEERLRLQEPIDSLLRSEKIGFVVRDFEADETCGFDVLVEDFVVGGGFNSSAIGSTRSSLGYPD